MEIGLATLSRRLAACAVATLVVLAASCGAASSATALTSVAQWGGPGSGPGQFSGPSDIAIDGAGNVYVADTLNARIQKFTPDGAFLAQWGSAGTGLGQFEAPAGVAAGIGPSLDGSIFVSDVGGHRVQRFDANGGSPTVFAVRGSGDGQVETPTGIAAVGRYVYIADWGNYRVQQFAPDGSFLRMWGWGVSDRSSAFQVCTSGCQRGTGGAGDGQFTEIRGIGVGAPGSAAEAVYVAGRGSHRIQEFGPDGAFHLKWGTYGTAEGQIRSPSDVAPDAEGNVWVADAGNDRLQKFSSRGAFIEAQSSFGGDETFEPFGVAIDAAGFIYVADRRGNRILKFAEEAPPTAPPPPVLGEAVNVAPVRGEVFVSVPSGAAGAARSVPGLKGREFVPLSEVRQIPVGSLLDTREGTVRLASARNKRGKTQSGNFTGGVFQVLQSRKRSAKGLTELRMKGSEAGFRSCGKNSRGASAALSRRTIRRLRAKARGRYRTRGRHSAATVRGTTWTVEDRCDGTLTTVKRGSVSVRDFRLKKTIVVKAGKSYLAAARG